MDSAHKLLSEPLLNDHDTEKEGDFSICQDKWGHFWWNKACWLLFACLWLLITIGTAETYSHFRVNRAKRLCGQLLYCKPATGCVYDSSLS